MKSAWLFMVLAVPLAPAVTVTNEPLADTYFEAYGNEGRNFGPENARGRKAPAFPAASTAMLVLFQSRTSACICAGLP